MNRPRHEREKEYYALCDMKAEVESNLLQIPGVVAVSIGLKVSAGIPTEEISFRVYVDKKKNNHELNSDEIVPVLIKGIKTDVNELPWGLTPADDDNKYRPLCGGIQISSSGDPVYSSGTLGCFALDLSTPDKKVVMLTNYHVLKISGEEEGHPVSQPDFCCDECCCRCRGVAKLKTGSWDNVDCAIATLSNGHEKDWTNEIPGLGPISCIPVTAAFVPINPDTGGITATGDPLKPYLPYMVGDRVFKRGKRTAEVREGIIIEPTSVNFSIEYAAKGGGVTTRPYHDQIWIEPLSGPSSKPFSAKGDSGSVVLNHLNQVIGLFFADNEDLINNVDATISWVNPIQDVLKILNINIPDTGTPLAMPLNSISSPAVILKKDALDELEARIESHPDGHELIGIFKKNRKEVIRLINTNREVMVTWNRYHGPAFIANLLEKEKNANHVMPQEIEGVSWQRLLSKMSVVLEQHGSSELTSDIGAYSTKIFRLVKDMLLNNSYGYA